MEWAALTRAALALLFATAAVAKLGRFGGFVAAVRGYGIVPSWAVPAAAVATVLTEVVIRPNRWSVQSA